MLKRRALRSDPWRASVFIRFTKPICRAFIPNSSDAGLLGANNRLVIHNNFFSDRERSDARRRFIQISDLSTIVVSVVN